MSEVVKKEVAKIQCKFEGSFNGGKIVVTHTGTLPNITMLRSTYQYSSSNVARVVQAWSENRQPIIEVSSFQSAEDLKHIVDKLAQELVMVLTKARAVTYTASIKLEESANV